MKFLDTLKNNLENQKYRIQLTYLGGHPDISSRMLIHIERKDDHINLCRGHKILTEIPLSAIKSIRLERASSRSTGKAATGAIVGAVIAGPLGLIAGGALGGRKKNESVILVTVQLGSSQSEILFGGVGKRGAEIKYPKFVKLLN